MISITVLFLALEVTHSTKNDADALQYIEKYVTGDRTKTTKGYFRNAE